MDEIGQAFTAPLISLGGVEFMPVISLGNMITLAIAVIGAFVAVGKTLQCVRGTQAEVAKLSADLDALRQDVRSFTTVLLSYKMSGTIEERGEHDDD